MTAYSKSFRFMHLAGILPDPPGIFGYNRANERAGLLVFLYTPGITWNKALKIEMAGVLKDFCAESGVILGDEEAFRMVHEKAKGGYTDRSNLTVNEYTHDPGKAQVTLSNRYYGAYKTLRCRTTRLRIAEAT